MNGASHERKCEGKSTLRPPLERQRQKEKGGLLLLFNSLEFLLLFLPVSVIGYFAIARTNRTAAATWLALCSFVFYGWWDPRYIPLLLLSIALNFLIGGMLMRHSGTRLGSSILAVGVGANLAILGFFKYTDFFLNSANAIAGTDIPLLGLALPLGISFFTFTQIAFLIDAYRGEVREYRFIHYALFVTYFPHLIAGPVLHHKEMMPQFERIANYQPRVTNFIIGTAIFIIGLAKKVLIADNLAPHANGLFDAPGAPSLLLAWGGTLAYAFQLYFDFSGYSDMAIGLSRLFGVKLPLNFNSPYKARNISEFWRRWHMTLSRFLRDYLYIPLGGNRRGKVRRYVNLMITMLLGGLWHGAGWNFVIWGGLHGAYLCIHQLWRRISPPGIRFSAFAGTLLTFLAVLFGWVFFRATTLEHATAVVGGMAGLNGIAIPNAIAARLGPVQPLLAGWGVDTFLGGGTSFVTMWAWVAFAAGIAFFAPTTQQIIGRFVPALPGEEAIRSQTRVRFSLKPRWALALGLLATVCVLSLSQPTEFLYFQF